MDIYIYKKDRRLEYNFGGQRIRCKIALGREPAGKKERAGDGKTPEGMYFVCLKKENGKFGPSLGISYPSFQDALEGERTGIIDKSIIHLFEEAEKHKKRPPWGTALGGEIYIHGGGNEQNWTAGCVALQDDEMKRLFDASAEGDRVIILP